MWPRRDGWTPFWRARLDHFALGLPVYLREQGCGVRCDHSPPARRLPALGSSPVCRASLLLATRVPVAVGRRYSEYYCHAL